MVKNKRQANYDQLLKVRVTSQQKNELSNYAKTYLSQSELFRQIFSKRWKQISKSRSDIDFKIYNQLQSLKKSIQNSQLSQDEIVNAIEEIQLLRLNIEVDTPTD